MLSFDYKNPSKISQIFNSMPARTSTPLSPITRTMPFTGQTFQSAVVAPPAAPVVPAAPAAAPVFTPRTAPVAAPVASAPATSSAPAGLDYSKYTDPVTGKVMTPQEYADFLAKRATGGSIPAYAGDSATKGPQTTAQLQSTATDLNNQRNDIATGATDPYAVASKSGIAYSPSEMAAIEKAYAGIYDPAIKDVFSKLDQKQKEDAAALELKNQLSLQAQKHKDDISLKQTPTAAENLAGTTIGNYVPGADPVTDSWAAHVQNGGKITDVPAAYKNKVAVALQYAGNNAQGKPTTTEIGLQTLDAAKRLLDMFDKGQGTSTVGKSRLFGGGITTPGSDSANFVNLFDTLSANKSLEGVKFLKGQGAVSDAERNLLKQAMSELNLSQSEDAFRSSLEKIITKLEGGGSADSGISVTDPEGGIHTFKTQADADAFKKAIGQ